MFTLTNIVIGQTVALPSSIQRVSERRTWETRGRGLKLTVQIYLHLAVAYLWGGLGCSTPPPPRNSEGPPKSCQTQPDCENC